MEFYYLMDAGSGCILQRQSNPDHDDTQFVLPAEEPFKDPGAEYYDGTDWVARPDPIELPSIVAAPYTIGFAALAENATVQAINEDRDVLSTDDPSDPITLVEAGVYLVNINQPDPHHDVSAVIQVQNA